MKDILSWFNLTYLQAPLVLSADQKSEFDTQVHASDDMQRAPLEEEEDKGLMTQDELLE